MLVAEYSYEEDIQVKRQEAMQRGIQQGMQNGMILSGKIFQAVKKNPDFTDIGIAEAVGCEAGQVESVRKMFGI